MLTSVTITKISTGLCIPDAVHATAIVRQLCNETEVIE